MARTATSLLLRRFLRRFLRHPIPSPWPFLSHHHPLFYSSRAASQSSSLVGSRAVSQAEAMQQAGASLRLEYAKEKPELSAKENISNVLDSKIDCAERKRVDRPDLELSNDFPFEIVANPGRSITLKREFAGEKIQVTAYNIGEYMSEDDEDGGSAMPKFSLIALIDKGNETSLEFWCNLDADGFHIRRMLLRIDEHYEDSYDDRNGPEFSDLDENLQKPFYKYLEERGISPSLREFLPEYMTQKKDRDYLNWLKNMKSFIEK
ncbi:Mitochondrial glycoprotein [Dioscorea alata]|uniref:Mitochondrial glycoprotein n=1 Tax=Dioscorea alata TaxID=55571 RepID=A0ACB7WN09_DIOAL|nr:Mitochondrial glycoprotein [Dioscorea alata]